jgi:hypothetical protein
LDIAAAAEEHRVTLRGDGKAGTVSRPRPVSPWEWWKGGGAIAVGIVEHATDDKLERFNIQMLTESNADRLERPTALRLGGAILRVQFLFP